MSGIGPELPPHLLAKRKRQQEEEAENETVTASGAKRSLSPSDGEKRRRVIGPAMPPAPLEKRPKAPPNQSGESDSDDDDGFGPTLPPNGTAEVKATTRDRESESDSTRIGSVLVEEKPKRDDWMMMPPKQDDLAARMDPTKQRPRAFNTGEGARGPNVLRDDSSAWNETPEQKQKRLADEMMGVSKPFATGPQRPSKGSDAARDEAAAEKIREQTEKTRGPSLLDKHKKSKGTEAEDDPSKRAFDREKDMGSGMHIGRAQKQEMLNKASNFSSKFSGGSYL